MKPGTASHVAEQFLLGSLALLLSTRAPLPIKVSSFVSICVSLVSSLPSVRQEPALVPWKGSSLLRHEMCRRGGDVVQSRPSMLE